MHRVAASALALALLAPGCTNYRMHLADEALRSGNYKRSFTLLKSLAKRGHAHPQYRVAVMLTLGQGVEKDEDRAVFWFRKAARQGHVEASAKLAHFYLGGRGRPEADPDAERWLREAAERGRGDIRYRVGLLYLDGRNIPQSDAEALRWFRLAAKSWDSPSEDIATRIDNDGYLRRIAELGLGEAQYRMGQRFVTGNDVPLSRPEATKWYFLSAEQGFLWGQMAIAWAYAQGDGVPKDLAEASRWFRKAAEQGEPEAQYQFGLTLERGLGRPVDLVGAHQWFNLAASKGHWLATQARDALRGKLSGAQLAQAEKRAIEWVLKREAERP